MPKIPRRPSAGDFSGAFARVSCASSDDGRRDGHEQGDSARFSSPKPLQGRDADILRGKVLRGEGAYDQRDSSIPVARGGTALTYDGVPGGCGLRGEAGQVLLYFRP